MQQAMPLGKIRPNTLGLAFGRGKFHEMIIALQPSLLCVFGLFCCHVLSIDNEEKAEL